MEWNTAHAGGWCHIFREILSKLLMFPKKINAFQSNESENPGLKGTYAVISISQELIGDSMEAKQNLMSEAVSIPMHACVHVTVAGQPFSEHDQGSVLCVSN